MFGKKMPDTEVFFDEPQALEMAKAIERGDVDSIRQAASKLDINQQHVRGMTFLSWAFAHLNYESAEALVALGADPHIETEGISPLSWAMDLKDIRWLTLLVEAGADINTKKDGTPLWFSTVTSDNWKHFDYLLDKEVDVHAASKSGQTMIFRLAADRAFDKVLKLIDIGADVHVETAGGLSFARQVQDRDVAADHPQYQNWQKVIELLKQKGIQFPAPSAAEVREQRAKAQ